MYSGYIMDVNGIEVGHAQDIDVDRMHSDTVNMGQ